MNGNGSRRIRGKDRPMVHMDRRSSGGWNTIVAICVRSVTDGHEEFQNSLRHDIKLVTSFGRATIKVAIAIGAWVILFNS